MTLSCITKDQATSYNHLLSDEYSNKPDTPIVFDFEKDITLNVFDFIVRGKGEKPVYCQRPYVQGLAVDGSGAKVIYTTCGTMGCPSCSQLWVFEEIFKTAVHVEAFARYSGSRPARGSGSVSYDRTFTVDQIRKIGRSINNKLKKQGVTAGVKMFHPFRIKDDVKKALRSILSSDDSSGFWKFLRDDHNLGNIDKLNGVLGTDFIDLYNCVVLAPHYHFICFPGNQMFTGNKELVLKKEYLSDGDNKNWTLDSSEAVVRYLTYLISHCGQLNHKETYLRPISPFGEMHKLSAEKLVSPEVLNEIRLDVLSVMNQGREKLLVLDGDSISFAVPEEKVEKTFIPMSDFRLTSLEAHANASAFVSGVRIGDYSENAAYIDYLIDQYNVICESSEVPQKFKRLFCSPFVELPDFVLSMASYSPIRAMFEKGLCAPPDTFKFFVFGGGI